MQDLTEKIDHLCNLAVEEYGVPSDLMDYQKKQALWINEALLILGVPKNNIFMGENGTFCMVAYWDHITVEITILDNELFDAFFETTKVSNFYVQNVDKKYIWSLLQTASWAMAFSVAK